MDPAVDRDFLDWLEALERRHLSELSFPEVRRGVQALSHWYVQRRAAQGEVKPGAALDGRGKRAAFALFYGPLHFLVVRNIVRETGLGQAPLSRLVDLGCGTGAAAPGWAMELPEPRPKLEGVEIHPWAVAEARWTWHKLGLAGGVRCGRAERAQLPGRGCGVLLAYVVNELTDAQRGTVLARLLEAGRNGTRVLIVEPIARRPVPWWDGWARAFESAGGHHASWRFRIELPPRLRSLDRAAGLRHDELTARGLWL